jgi:quinol monooxygenase YgiN
VGPGSHETSGGGWGESDDPFADLGEQALTILTKLKVAPAHAGRFLGLFEAYADCVRQHEPGCSAYQVVRAVGAPNDVLIIARYRSLEAYRAHVQSTHTISILSMLGPLLLEHPVLEIYVD